MQKVCVLMEEIQALRRAYDALAAQGLSLDMSRGKPSPEQLSLSRPMLQAADMDYTCEDGTDARNYADPYGIPEARRLFGQLLGAPAAQVIIGGNSSLNLLCDVLTRCMLLGALPDDKPWREREQVKIICPVPGYDWHFRMLQTLGMQPVPVATLENGPDMDAVERLALDPDVKGLVCVPMYGNPSGVTYSDEAVRRLAAMKAAPDFRLFWDNAYCVHPLDPTRPDHLLNIFDACAEAGNPDRAFAFTSFSKITWPGGGLAGMASSPRSIARQQELMLYQQVCHDKMNQLRHVRFLPDLSAVEQHMAKQAALIRPKFELVLTTLRRELTGIAEWSEPRGGYFICFRAPIGCAKRIVSLCADAGVKLTPAGAAFPFDLDPEDSVIRIAPTYPPISELAAAMAVFVAAVKLAAAEKSQGGTYEPD